MDTQPVIFEPIYKPKLWGGNRIFRQFGRPAVGDEPIGESWELADLETDQSVVRDGPLAGTRLEQLREMWKRDLLGGAPLFEGRFPLLIKFLDAQQSLSVQVHPSAAVARRLGGRVRIKNEAWYVLGVEPDGVIYHGLEPGVTEEGFRSAMTTGRLEGVLRRIPVRPGECYDLPSGTPHALGAGVLVTEVQTPSDVTYRTYDWGRVDPKTGQPRALDLDRAIECIDFTRASPSPQQAVETRTDDGIQIRRLVHCVSFRIEHWRIDGPTDRDVRRGQMAVWILLKGGGTLSTGGRDGDMTFHKGDVLLLPAGLPTSVVRFNGPTALLHVTVPSA